MSNYGLEDYKRQPFHATEAIAELLHHGALRLFLGAGVSQGFGLPNWKQLLVRLVGDEANPSSTHESLQRALNAIDDGSEAYVRKVHEALYRDAPEDLGDLLPRSPLLLGIAAMTTGAHRGRVESIVTYNYDDVLEQYMRMLGLKVCPRMLPDSLSVRCDLEINYVHGRLPQDLDPGGGLATRPDIMLSEKSFRTKRATIDEGWSALVEHGLRSKVGLFIGLSGNDGTPLDLLERLKRKVDGRRQDFLGYWLLTPRAYAANAETISSVQVCPIKLRADEIPKFIFRTCTAAASLS